MTEWRQFKLKDILEPDGYIRGPFGSSLRRGELKNEGIPVYEQEHAIKGIRKFRYYIDQNKFNELKRFCVKTGDIIISCSGTVGEVSVIKEEDPKGIISQALLILRADKNVAYQPFLKYFLMSPYGKSSITSRSDGSVQVNIAKRQVIENIDILLPPLPEQKAIAEVLSSLDDKIDLLTRQNKTLEDIAQAYFRKWFIEDASDKWEEIPLGQLFVISSGKGLKKEKFTEHGQYRVLGANGEIGKTNEYLFNERLIYTGRVGTLGNVFIVDREPVWLSDNTLVFRNIKYFFFVYFSLKWANLADYNVGSTQPLIRQSDIKEIRVFMPDKERLDSFENLANSIFAKINSNQKQIQLLQKLRDTLLPKLISGEIRVKM
jgi:type I restriction enzyme S subunit